MANIEKCSSCQRENRYAKSAKSTVCAKCLQEGKATEIKLESKIKKDK